MSTQLDGFPEPLVGADLTSAAAHLELDETLYPLEAIYGASYIFIDRCYVLIDRPVAGRFRVTLSAKKPPIDAEALRALVGEFANELLACAWRHQITSDNRATIEAVTMQAIAGAMGPASLDELAKFDFSAEAFEDPLGIATSWEEKYKKKPAAGDGGEQP
jgi:His-Xaa-Ser system protein HxsD